MFSLQPIRMTAATRKLAMACALGAGVASMPAHAVDFTEHGDAGQTQATAQVGAGAPGALNNIFGALSSSADADLYVIDISNPNSFSASTMNSATGFDTQLFLLTLSGAPIALNDDDAGGLSSASTLPAGSFGSLAAGRYLLGVSLSGFDPANTANQLLFASGLSTDLRGAVSGLQPAFLGGFSDDTFTADSGSYQIQLSGVAAIPEPATNALLLAGGAVGAMVVRRRRAAAASNTV